MAHVSPRRPARDWWFPLACAALALLLLGATRVSRLLANPPRDDGQRGGVVTQGTEDREVLATFQKRTDRPNPKDAARVRQRRQLAERYEALLKQGAAPEKLALAKQMLSSALTGTDRVLVVLVEFDPAHPDTFTWTPGASTWDPYGKCDANEFTGDADIIGTPAAANNIIAKYNITGPQQFTYTGPLHNQIERPRSADDASGDFIWTPDFTPGWYQAMIFGNGVTFNYTRQDSSVVNLDFQGKSVRDYYRDLSNNQYDITGDVVGWVKVPHSIWWYGADPAPGARSGVSSGHNGGIPGAGNAYTLVIDALEAVKAANPNFNWQQYDQDGDGVIDRLWIIHAGIGEEDSPTLLDRTTYGEGGIWSHSSGLTPAYEIDPVNHISAGPYIMMPENCGIGVLAHEYGHNLGADDLYAYGDGETSAGFWTLMADDWTGYPLGFQPPAVDPWHLDGWGWLHPKVVDNPSKVYKVTLGQASRFLGQADQVRGAKILLQDGARPLPVTPNGGHYWWSGREDNSNGMMTLKTPVSLPATGDLQLSFKLAYDIEEMWDFLWIQASEDGQTWTTLTNANTSSAHDSGWIGSLYGFPDDLAAAGVGGFSGWNGNWPQLEPQTFSLNAFAGKSIYLRFWYMTDWGTVYGGAFVDEITVTAGGATLFSDNAETGAANWDYTTPWQRNAGSETFTHNYYLQWRNTGATGGYDSSLGGANWRFGPVNSGLLVWYNNNFYRDNEIFNYLFDYPSFGPKGRMLVVDAHPEPYRDPYYVAQGYANEGANVFTRSLVRDAPFSLTPSVDFTMKPPFVHDVTNFTGRPAVSTFSDAQGYYPGAEYVSRGPGYTPPSFKWVTKQWDASVVLPGTVAYPVKAPGYTTNEEFRYYAQRYPDGLLACYWLGSGVGLGYHGGDGNPGSANGQYGWNVKLLNQSDTAGTVVIWNSFQVAPLQPQPDTFHVQNNATLNVLAPGVLTNDQGPDGWRDVASAQLVSNVAHGTLTFNGNGSFTYVATAGYVGQDSFSYKVVTSYDAVSAPVMVTLQVYNPLTQVTLTAAPATRQLVNRPIVLTAQADGGWQVQYCFRAGYKTGTTWTWTTVRDYQADNTCTWTPDTARNWTLAVWVKEEGFTGSYQQGASQVYTVVPELTMVNLAVSPPPPAQINTPILLTATPVGGLNVQYWFRVGYKDANNCWYWSTLRSYNAKNTCTWVPAIPVTYTVVVYAREAGSTKDYDVYKSMYYAITSAPPKGVLLTANPPSPKKANTPITLTAYVSGAGWFDYRFRVGYQDVGGTWHWSDLKSYSTDNTCVWSPSAPGKYTLVVYVRETGSGVGYRVFHSIWYNVLAP